ncbi:MAG: protein translocase subunit SecD [Candidatus Binatus sp.]|uniref:protein translocase subunit SecD n=1 Tax=Candidatus Binatus sp. TaxID=2811406 RepID=UPI002726A46E|nr:protein translocase subunit SecD [Candidatus Binatus sp.]MDO8432881.1 protein translocase subunit SecD [Candidatus Binatus sp.]
MDSQSENIGPVLIMAALIAVFLYLHFTGGSGLTRIYVAAALVVSALVILLPSLNVDLPDWYKATLGTAKIQLGLDLQGGTHLLMSVKLDEAVKTQLRRRGDDLKRELKANKLDVDSVGVDDSGRMIVKLKTSDERTPFLDLAQKSFSDLVVSSVTDASGPTYSLDFKPSEAALIRTNAMDQALETIRNRIDQLGVRETTVAREGDNEILVQLPGIQDPERAKELIGKTAVLEFKLVDDSHNVEDAVKDGPPPGDDLLYGSAERGGRTPYLVEAPLLMQGDVVTDARVRPGGRLEGPYVGVELDARGAQIFDAMTAENVGRKLAIILDKTVYSAPVIKERIPGGHVQINGRFSINEAHDLAIVLKSGALPAPVEIEEERTVGPSLGRDSIRAGIMSFVIGAGAVLIFMAVYYDGAGLLADFGLSLNILLLICVMAAMGATLTLPGIAGIVLTLGMSVDANVLVNERMREELRSGKSPREAVKLGYQRAWSAIRDSNISTFAAGLILFNFGTGPVKGFAVTLCVGVLTGLFSCIVVTRAWYDYLISIRRLNAISV